MRMNTALADYAKGLQAESDTVRQYSPVPNNLTKMLNALFLLHTDGDRSQK